MKVVKLVGKKYEIGELEENSKVVRKWLVVKKLQKEEITGKYHEIKNGDEVTSKFKEMLEKENDDTRKFYEEYINENWKDTFPIMKDVSAYIKIRPEDGTEFCILI